MSLAKDAAFVSELNCVRSNPEVPLVNVWPSGKPFSCAKIKNRINVKYNDIILTNFKLIIKIFYNK